MIPQVRGLKFTYKGGKGSGHHGHTGGEGGKGKPGGSKPGGGGTISRGAGVSTGGDPKDIDPSKGRYITSITDKQTDKWTEQIEISWEGKRLDSAYAALDDMKSNKAQGIVIEENGKLKGIISMEENEYGELWLNNLATQEKGYGTKMMREALKVSSNKQKTLKWWASESAEPFYKKLGFKKLANGSFSVRASTAKKWLAQVKVKSKFVELDDTKLMESEPKDGVFIVPIRSKE